MADPFEEAAGGAVDTAAPPPTTIDPFEAAASDPFEEAADSALTTQEKRLAQPPEPEPSALVKELQDINAAAFNQAASRTAMDFLGAWGAQQEFTPEQIDDAAHQSLYRYGEFMTLSGADKLPGMQEEKKQIRNAHLALELAARLPVPPDERKKLARSTITKMVQRRLAEVSEQFQGSSKTVYDEKTGKPKGLTGGVGREEAEQLYGVGQRLLQHLTDDDADKIYARALYESSTPPVNSQEGKLMEESMGLGWIWGPSAPGGEGALSPEQMRTDLDHLFGGQGLPMLRDEMVRNKTAFTLARRGLVDGRPGYTPDGLNFTLFVPGGTMERLTAAHVQYDPAAQESILQVRRKNGPLAAQAYQQQLVEKTLDDTIGHLATLTSQPPEVDPAFTPTQREEAGVLGVWADALKDIAGGLKGAIRATDNTLSRSRFVRESMIPSLMREYAGDLDMGAHVTNLAEVLTNVLRVNKQMLTTGAGALRERVKGMGLNPDSPAARQLLLSIDQSIAGGVQEYWKDTYKDQDDQRAYLGRWQRGLEPFDATKLAGAVGKLFFGNVVMGAAEQLSLVVDDPHEAAAQLVLGAAIGKATLPITRGLGDVETALLNNWRLGNDIRSAIRRHPWKIKTYVDAGKRLVRDGLKTGRAADTLNNMVAVLETFMERRAGDGVGESLGEVASVVKRAWPELRDGLGQEGYMMGTKLIPRNVIGQLGRLTGLLKQPSKKLSAAIIGADETVNKVLGVVKDLQGSGPIARELHANVRAFVDREGVAPTPEQVLDLMPEAMVDVASLMRAAEQNNLSDASVGKVWQKLTGLGREPDFAALAGSVEDVLNQYTNGAIGLIDSHGRWGIVRDRATIITDTAFKRLDIQAQALEYKLDQLRQLQGPGHPEIAAQIKAAEAGLFDLRRQTNRVGEAKARILKHDASKPWSWAPEDAEILFGARPDGSRLIDGETLDLTLRLHPALFEGVLPESLWQTKKGALPAQELFELNKRGAALDENIKLARADAAKARKGRIDNDAALNDWKAEAARHQTKIKELPENDPLLVATRARLAELEKSIGERTTQIKEKLVVPQHVLDTRARLDQVVEARKAHRAEVKRRKADATVRELDPDQYARVLGMVEHEGLTDLAREGMSVLGQHQKQAGVLKLARQYGNPYDARWLPARHKSKLIHDQLQSMGWLFQSGVQLAADFADVLNRVPQVVRDIIGEAQKTGKMPSAELFDQYPELAQVYKDANGLNTVKSNIQFYLEKEGRTFEEFLGLMEDIGWAPKHVVDAWRKGDYNPRLFAVGRREAFVTRKGAKQRLQKESKLGSHPELAAVAQDREELMFRREPGKWRLRAVETDRVVDRLFDDKTALNTYMEETYGRDAWKDIGGLEKGKHRGKTVYNEPITIGSPLTDEERITNDEVFGNTPEKRLIRLEGLMKNSYLNALSEALNAFGGMVVTPEQYLAEGLARFSDQYQPVPNNPEVYGSLAGKYVHRRVLGQLAEASRTFETFHGLLKGYMEEIETTGPGNKILGALGRIGNQWDNIAKSNMILKSPRTWGANVLFNFISAKLAGASRFLSAEGMGMFWDKVVKERPGERGRLSPVPQKDPTDIAWSRLRDDTLQRARQHGLVGGLFEAENEAMRTLGRRVFGLTPEDGKKLEALQIRRRDVREQIRQAKLAGGRGQDALLSRLDRDAVAIDEAVSEMNAGWLKKTGRKLASFFVEMGKRDAVGRPTNQWWHDMKRFYNHIDEASKVLMFQELTEVQGLPDDMAAGRIKMFAQDYAGLPPVVRRIAKSGVNSLVTSFPAEAYRIGANAMLHAPNQFLSIMMAIPFLNMMQFTMGGIGWDRAVAMLEARGQKSGVDKLSALFTDLYTVDPRRRAITGSMGFSNLLPFAGLFKDKGLLGMAYDKWVPPEQKGLWAEAGRAATGFASNFVGSAPKFNWLGYLFTGQDPRTGQVLIDDKMPLWKKVKTFGSLLAQDTLMPTAPGGRDWEALMRAGKAGVSPKTGRLRGAEEPITALVRGLTGVTVRGTVAEKLAGLLGVGTRARDPVLVDDDDLIIKAGYDAAKAVPRVLGTDPGRHAQYGEHDELRDLILRTKDPSLTEEQRKRADADAEQLYKQMHQFELGVVKGAVSITEREFRLFKAKVLQDDPAGWFATLPVHVQATALANLDQWRVRDDKLRELIKRSMFSDNLQIRQPTDPQAVQVALDILDQRIKEPGHSPRLDEYRAWLGKLKGISEAHELKDSLLFPLNQVKKAAVRKKLK
jgi:hypothetical protein